MPNPLDVQERGPFQNPTGGPAFWVRRSVMNRPQPRIECETTPYSTTYLHEPPNHCRWRKEYRCWSIREEEITVEIIEAVKRTSWMWWVGAGLLAIGLVATGLGVVALIGLALDAAFVTGVTAATVWAAVGAGAAATYGGTQLIKLEADKYEYGQLLDSRSETVEISRDQASSRVEENRVPCEGE